MHLVSDPLWAEIKVESEETMALAEQLAAMPVLSSSLEEQSQVNKIYNTKYILKGYKGKISCTRV